MSTQYGRVAEVERRIVVVRHAKAAWPESVPDFDRPLAERGRADAATAGQWLREHVSPMDMVVCSPAQRARQTWDLAANELETKLDVRWDERVYQASAETLVELLRELPTSAATAVVVGHNPELEELVALLTGVDEELKTSAIAVLAGIGEWTRIEPRSARLINLVTPRA